MNKENYTAYRFEAFKSGVLVASKKKSLHKNRPKYDLHIVHEVWKNELSRVGVIFGSTRIINRKTSKEVKL